MCAIGRIPARESPPATLISNCSLIPTLITRSGKRRADGRNASAEMSASTTASRGSSASRPLVTAAKRSRMVSMIVSYRAGVADDSGPAGNWGPADDLGWTTAATMCGRPGCAAVSAASSAS